MGDHTAFAFLCLIMVFSIIYSRFVYVVANFHSFLWLNNIALCRGVCVCVCVSVCVCDIVVQFPQHHLLKRLSFPHVYIWLLCCKLIDHTCMDLFLGSLFCSIDQYHTDWLLELHNTVWKEEVWCLQLCASFLRLLCLLGVYGPCNYFVLICIFLTTRCEASFHMFVISISSSVYHQFLNVFVIYVSVYLV